MKSSPSAQPSECDDLLTSGHVWHLSPDVLCGEVLQRHCLDWLTPQERGRRQRLRTGQLQHNYLASRALCRWTLSRYTGVEPHDWQFIENRHGKPEIAAPAEFNSLRFNLTHTEHLAACIVTRVGEVGLDAEEMSRPIDVAALAGHFFSPAEREGLAAVPLHGRTARFFEYWVLKEAYLKARGTGLSLPPDQFTIAWQVDGRPAPLDGWRFALHHPTPAHVAATALPLLPQAPAPPVWRSADIFL